MKEKQIRLFGIGAGKTGTHSIEGVFRKQLRTAHEPEKQRLLDLLFAINRNPQRRPELRQYLADRDQRLNLQVDSSMLNLHTLPELVDLFPTARFILTMRDPYSWIDSYFNHILTGGRGRRWNKMRDIWFRKHELHHPPEEAILEQNGLYTLDGMLYYWTWHNQTALETVPAQRLLVVRTDEITARAAELVAFVGLPVEPASLDNVHLSRAREKRNLLASLDQSYLKAKVDAHCSPLIQEFFPDLRAASDAASCLNGSDT